MKKEVEQTMLRSGYRFCQVQPEGIGVYYKYYQEVLIDECLMGQFNERQIQYMRTYTEEFMKEKQKAVIARITEWIGEEKAEKFLQLINNK